MFDFFKKIINKNKVTESVEMIQYEHEYKLGKYSIAFQMMNGNNFSFDFEEYLFDNALNKYSIEDEINLIKCSEIKTASGLDTWGSSLFTFTDVQGTIVMVQTDNVDRIFIRKLSETTTKVKRVKIK